MSGETTAGAGGAAPPWGRRCAIGHVMRRTRIVGAAGLFVLAACTDPAVDGAGDGGSATDPAYRGGEPPADAGPGGADAAVRSGGDAARGPRSGDAGRTPSPGHGDAASSGDPGAPDAAGDAESAPPDGGAPAPADATETADAAAPPTDAAGPPADAAPVSEDTAAPADDVQASVCAACGPDQVCAGGACVPSCQGSCACVPGPGECPNPPGGGQIPGAVTPDAFGTLVALSGQSAHWPPCTAGDELACHLFLREATRHLYEQDPNWGLLTKVPGQNQCSATACGNGVSCGYAVDAIIYRATNQVVDIIVAIGSPGASLAWQLVGKLDYNHWAPPPCMPEQAAPAATDTLASGASLAPGQALLSADGRFRLEYQADGDLVLTYLGVGPLWSTGTQGAPGSVSMQGDGNLVVYDAGGTPVWASGTEGNPGASLLVQADGNVVLYAPGGAPVWATGTCCY